MNTLASLHYSSPDYWHYIADEGYYFHKGNIIAKEIYLSKFDYINNWTVITETEKLELEKINPS